MKCNISDDIWEKELRSMVENNKQDLRKHLSKLVSGK